MESYFRKLQDIQKRISGGGWAYSWFNFFLVW